ncbi:hypothetical protein ACL9RL_03070 [Plantibacter sp. Mn2098]|uniref:hypothetical protein n=1 Tax=Plantibacter sp. Mn2098 TaxID=3395266 RepID=UPI003BC9A5FC
MSMISTNRAVAAAVVAAALLPVLTLTGCAPKTPDTEPIRDQIVQLNGVEGASVRMTKSGLPTNRTVDVQLFVQSAESVDLPKLLEGALEAAWTRSDVEPSSGVKVAVIVGEDPTKRVEYLENVTTLPLGQAATALGFGTDEYSDFDRFISVWKNGMVAHYGEWKPAS